MEFFRDLFILLGRVFISALFLSGAVEKIMHKHHTMEQMKMRGVPQVRLMYPIGLALMLIGGVSVLLGLFARFGAFLLIVYLVPTLYWTHNFWSSKEMDKRKTDKAFFMKGLAVLGGLLYVLATGSGRYGF